MAVTFTITDAEATEVPPNPQVFGTLKCRVVNVACAGTYTDEGDALAAGAFGLDKIVLFLPEPAAAASDGETAVVVKYDYANAKLLMFESGGANAALAEKTGAEAVPTGMAFRALVFGY